MSAEHTQKIERILSEMAALVEAKKIPMNRLKLLRL